MIYVIEALLKGEWTHVRDINGMPLMFSIRRDALRALTNRQSKFPGLMFRITKVRD